jgi:hypothetical protein
VKVIELIPSAGSFTYSTPDIPHMREEPGRSSVKVPEGVR